MMASCWRWQTAASMRMNVTRFNKSAASFCAIFGHSLDDLGKTRATIGVGTVNDFCPPACDSSCSSEGSKAAHRQTAPALPPLQHTRPPRQLSKQLPSTTPTPKLNRAHHIRTDRTSCRASTSATTTETSPSTPEAFLSPRPHPPVLLSSAPSTMAVLSLQQIPEQRAVP